MCYYFFMDNIQGPNRFNKKQGNVPENIETGKISIKQCILRIFFSLIGGHILLIFNDKSLHDLISKTHIIKKDS